MSQAGEEGQGRRQAQRGRPWWGREKVARVCQVWQSEGQRSRRFDRKESLRRLLCPCVEIGSDGLVNDWVLVKTHPNLRISEIRRSLRGDSGLKLMLDKLRCLRWQRSPSSWLRSKYDDASYWRWYDKNVLGYVNTRWNCWIEWVLCCDCCIDHVIAI